VLDHQAQALIERSISLVRLGQLMFQTTGHALQAQAVQLLDQWFGQHRVISFTSVGYS